MTGFKEKAGWTAIGLGMRGLAMAINRVGKKDPMMGRALAEFDGVYQFKNRGGSINKCLVFGGGRVRLKNSVPWEPDFTFTLYEQPGYYLKTRPDRALELVIGNKISHTGDMYYLYQFGFIISLMDNYFRNRRKRP